MALLNYTTKIDANRSVSEIVNMLAKARAQAITQRMDGSGHVIGIEFSVITKFGQMGFRLPADPRPVVETLNRQAMAGQIPKRFKNDAAQARRVSWRIVRDWVQAQLAIIQIGMVNIEQVMLPYALDPSSGQTLFEMMTEQRFKQLALPEAK